MSALPLRLPPAPFSLDYALTGAALVSEAYRANRAWKKADRPDPEAFELPASEGLAAFEDVATIWADHRIGPFERSTPVALIGRVGATAYLGFRGTENPSDILVNLELRQRDYDLPKCDDFGPVHGGFMDRYEALRPSLVSELFEGLLARNRCERVVVAGHSMGAGVSTLAVPDLARNALDLDDVALVHYTFGSPRVGSPEFAEAFDRLAASRGQQNAMSYRVANSADPVTSIPPAIVERVLREDPLFQHVGTLVGLSENYGKVPINHHHGRTYCYALEHPENPHNPDAGAED